MSDELFKRFIRGIHAHEVAACQKAERVTIDPGNMWWRTDPFLIEKRRIVVGTYCFRRPKQGIGEAIEEVHPFEILYDVQPSSIVDLLDDVAAVVNHDTTAIKRSRKVCGKVF